MEWCPPQHLGVVAIEKGVFGSPSTKIASFTYLMYIIKEPKKTIKRHHNQIRKIYSEDINIQKEEPMKVIYDLFDVLTPLVAPEEKRSSKRKRTFFRDYGDKPEWRCPWCNCYRRRKWTRRHEFKSWTKLFAFHIALIPLGKVWIQLFSLQLWVNSRTD